MTNTETCVVADIGGTNGRFGVARFLPGEHKPHIEKVTVYACAEHMSISDMLGKYLTALGDERPQLARLAIAGPTTARHGRLTNISWQADAASLEAEHGLKNVTLLNDFGALAGACQFLEEGVDYVSLKKGADDATGPISVMGPGTGFGVALLVPVAGDWVTVPTEGGNMAFAPTTRLEHDLTEHLRAEMGHVSVETFLCGEGIARIHRFLVDYGGSGDRGLSPAEITKLAADGGAPSCTRAVQLFLSIIGSSAGNIALAHGATGGVFLGGGILPKIMGMVPSSDLLRRFVAKGPMQPYLDRIPVNLITAKYAALIGAAVL
ncbi:glucokinase [Kordiimonas gwangyangensis]|uniref:glucokinase n=1 Tax=Kordiimonas gwangyangensis TaxID=288022 RepID=UPI00036279F2|nr:glucokinase [Kordiimonas gwangyangensis]